MQKNAIDEMAANRCRLARTMLKNDDRSIVRRDVTGQARFNGVFRNARDLAAALDKIADVSADDRADMLALYEKTFTHHSFTGRSGAMYGYEGIGCIYWHMVAKLLLAVQENYWRAVDEEASHQTIDRLAALYARVRAGLGFNKSAQEYGAFPLDAYSHTPLHAGAQQPGMTGQVKEEILTRLGELGVRVTDGIVRFVPRLLSMDEFLTTPANWSVVGHDVRSHTIALDAGTLGFTVAGTPIVFHLGDHARTVVRHADGSIEEIENDVLSYAASRSLLSRDARIERIDVTVPRASLGQPPIERAISAMCQQGMTTHQEPTP